MFKTDSRKSITKTPLRVIKVIAQYVFTLELSDQTHVTH